LAIYREFGSSADPGVVFFIGTGFLEVSGYADGAAGHSVMLWLQVRDINAEHKRLAAAGLATSRQQHLGAATCSWRSHAVVGTRAAPAILAENPPTTVNSHNSVTFHGSWRVAAW
jgi:hypothetical protein